ncbi:heavy metal translocating P-type ATPase [Petropleomorpha daqingensis]|uniref:Heavy metal translocating P-type ATPase n=1 Tax=Petropleomorpha daqingensis TaxID=2026353 RepID=A0A853CAM8_9ACTN|nr:heavy metal translocating P-type ATPase [Petropleomorpha daqingensis]
MTTSATSAPATRTAAPDSGSRSRIWSLSEVRWAGAALVLFVLGGAAQLVAAPAPVWWALYLACYAVGGWEPAWAGVQALRERSLDVDLLMIVAAIGAAAIGQVFDGALLVVIFATSGALEAVATRRTEDAVRGLTDLAPEQATLLASGGAARSVPVLDLEVGDRVLVRPGEWLPADGVVVDGASEVDQASITGEPLPVDKRPGDDVFAGTGNGTGALTVEVRRPATGSVIARIAAMVEEASATKARTQLFVEKVEQRYSIGVVVATLAVFAVPLLLGDDLRGALLRAMTFMIVASPCAVVLATMPPLLSAIANAGRHGVLVKSAVVMERLGTVTAVALDKTGTLTTGAPEVVAVRPLTGGPCTEEDLLALAAAAEAPSEHPIGRAVVTAARERGLELLPASGFRARVGTGVTATVAGWTVRVGSPVSGAATGCPGIAAIVDGEQANGNTAVVVSLDERPVGVLAVADRLRPESAAAVAALRECTGSEPVLLTGDHRRAALALAGRAGIRDLRADQLPEDKVEAVRELQDAGHRVLLAGDGVNDAPALATADVGIAMGGIGSDLALSSADVVVVRDDLGAIPAAVRLSRRARRLVVQNLVLAATVIGVLVAWDLIGDLPLPLGVAGHEGSTILVALNGLRLLRRAEWQPAR